MSDVQPLQQSTQWLALEKHQQEMSQCKITELFAKNPNRTQELSLTASGLFFDYSRNLIDHETQTLLLELAKTANLEQAINAMFAGDTINNTEQRPALHVALRSPGSESEQEKAVQQTLEKMANFVQAVLSGEWLGHTGQVITDVVNIGIGGSDLGPAMVYEALTPYHRPALQSHFVSNVDPSHLAQILASLNPATTLFVIASKSFVTLETSKNSEAARQWLLDAAQQESALPKHFVAVSANVDKALAFGIAESNIFPMWDWVGGRYSLWSAIGLPLALGLGMDNFKDLLKGAHSMDEHFRHTPFEENMPVIMALLNIWYLNFFHAETQALLPYVQNLHLFPAFLQQLDMESLGKSVHKDGTGCNMATGGIVWGSAGTNGQHSFHQLLHQGTHLIPADFIATARSHYDNEEQHQHLLANCFAQSQALMQGKSLSAAQIELRHQGLSDEQVEEFAPHKVIAGNRPSSTIMLEQLNPESLGSLIAAYEHKVFVQSVILQINAFDQWGVELGKELSTDIFNEITAQGKTEKFDASTNGLINFYKARQDR